MYKNTGCSCPAMYLQGPSRPTTYNSQYCRQICQHLPRAGPVEGSLPSPAKQHLQTSSHLCFMTPPAAHYTDSPEKIGTKCSLVLLLTDGRTGNHTAETQPTQPGASHCASTAQRCFREDRRQCDSTNIDTAVHQPP